MCAPRYTDVNNKKVQGDSDGEGCLGTVRIMEVLRTRTYTSFPYSAMTRIRWGTLTAEPITSNDRPGQGPAEEQVNTGKKR